MSRYLEVFRWVGRNPCAVTRPAEELELRDVHIGMRQYQLLHHRLKAGLFQAPWEKLLSLELAPIFSAETCCGARSELHP